MRAGVTWVNDSKATNLDAMERAVAGVEGSVILIAGGKDKAAAVTPFAFAILAKVSPFTTTGMRSTFAATVLGAAAAGAATSVVVTSGVCHTLSSGLGMLLVTSATGRLAASGACAVSGIGAGTLSGTAVIPDSGFPRSR